MLFNLKKKKKKKFSLILKKKKKKNILKPKLCIFLFIFQENTITDP